MPAAAHLTGVPVARSGAYSGQGCWLKLLLHELLPADVQHCLYLDSNMLVRANPCTLLEGAERMFQVRWAVQEASLGGKPAQRATWPPVRISSS